MDERLIQRTRYILRSRTRRVQTMPAPLFVQTCGHFLNWIETHQVISAAIRYLDEIDGSFKNRIPLIVKEASVFEGNYAPGFYSASSSDAHAALCLAMVRAIASLAEIAEERHANVICNLGEYLTNNNRIEYDEAIEVLRDVAVDGLYEFLDERIDARNVLYAILEKYKQRSEWFHKSRLREAADVGLEGRFGERALAVDLQEYVLNQGVEFIVEPVSASGEADLILRDADGRYIVIDAKYLPADANRSHIRDKLAQGFNQVRRYCDDFNEQEGFLVVFSRTEKVIRIELDEVDGLRFLTVGGKKVYLLEISIAELPSASKAGKAKSVRIKRSELMEENQEEFEE